MNQLKELLNATFEHLYKDDNKIENESLYQSRIQTENSRSYCI